MALADTDERDARCRDWCAITTELDSHQSPHRHASPATAWEVWERFCLTTGVRPDLLDVSGDSIPILLLFAQRFFFLVPSLPVTSPSALELWKTPFVTWRRRSPGWGPLTLA